MKRFDIVRKRKWFFLVSVILSIAGIISMLVTGFNLGTDFKAGTRVQVQLGAGFNTSEVVRMFDELGLKGSHLTTAGNQGEVAVVRLADQITPEQEASIKKELKANFPNSQDPEIVSVNPEVAKEMTRKAFYALMAASIGIILYMAIRFEYRFAISGVISLLQVVLLVVSIFALFRIEIDLPFIAAILTIVGYSIHDTIVIFDRIREKMKFAKVKTKSELEDLVNDSLWETMNRSVNTILTVIFAAGALWLLGGQAIRNFSLALLIGLIIGGMSSILIASQLWVTWRARSLKEAK
ncbi:protein translocase subunit SecF [Effusibacillus lacus]|uniref:protein translocase subunit SecF n=2 Tax=Effusibacillus lacus TaxID=1348429 RepID=UPI00104B8C44|nr:protein translocase subunit SecF [Effusibacillus lacus]TCS68972.1 preprotein translocase SecF subunit [Effusibacillus lacus]